MVFLRSFASDVDIAFDWIFWHENSEDEDVSSVVKTMVSVCTILGTVMWLILFWDGAVFMHVARALDALAACCRSCLGRHQPFDEEKPQNYFSRKFTVTEGQLQFAGVVLEDLPQMFMSWYTDNSKEDATLLSFVANPVAVLNATTALFDIVIKMSEAWDLRNHVAENTIGMKFDSAVKSRPLDYAEAEKLAVDSGTKKVCNLSGYNLGDGAVESIGDYPDIDEMNLSQNNITKQGIVALVDSLKETTGGLKRLTIGSNHIGDVGAAALASLIREEDSNLEYLDISHAGISDVGAAALALAIRVNTKLKKLHLDNNPIGDDGLAALAEALLPNVTLEVLTISQKQCLDPKCTCSANQIQKSIQSGAHERGALAFAAAIIHKTKLQTISSLKQLDIPACSTQEGARMLEKSYMYAFKNGINCTLQHPGFNLPGMETEQEQLDP